MNASKREYPKRPLRWQNRSTQASPPRAVLLQERDQEYA